MHLTATHIEHVFLGALALFVLMECVLTMLQTHAAEGSAERVPPRFEGKLTLAAHRKAAAYTGETAQASLLLTFVGAGFALLMTFGNGLTALTATALALSSDMLVVQWMVLAAVLLAAALIEFPFGWYARFRVAERYGYMRRDRFEWLAKTLRETLAGWLVTLPLLALLMALLEATGDAWWTVGWTLWVLYLVWRWILSTRKGLFWGRRAKPVRDEGLRSLVRDFLAREGLEMTDLCVMTRPESWSHSHLVLAGFGRKRRVVLFAHAAARLTKAELLALIAHEVGHIRHGHALLRIVLYAAAGWIVFRTGGWASSAPEFFAGFGLTGLPTDRPGTYAGFVVACAVVTFPVLLYPLRPAVHLVSRLMQYDADAYAARRVSADAIAGALVRLHRDYATSLTPSRLYSLFHYRRPHAGMRVRAILDRARRRGIAPDRPADGTALPWTEEFLKEPALPANHPGVAGHDDPSYAVGLPAAQRPQTKVRESVPDFLLQFPEPTPSVPNETAGEATHNPKDSN